MPKPKKLDSPVAVVARPWRLQRTESTVRQNVAVLTFRGGLPAHPSVRAAEIKEAIEAFKANDPACRAFKSACDRIADAEASLERARKTIREMEDALAIALATSEARPSGGALQAEVDLAEHRHDIEFLQERQKTLREVLPGLRRKATIAVEGFLRDRSAAEMNLASPTLKDVCEEIERVLNDACLLEKFAAAQRGFFQVGSGYPSAEAIVGPIPVENVGTVDDCLGRGPVGRFQVQTVATIVPPEREPNVAEPFADRVPRAGDFAMVPLEPAMDK